MYTHKATSGETLIFDDYRREQLRGASIYIQPSRRVYIRFPGENLTAIYTYLYGAGVNPYRRTFEHLNGNRYDFRDENVREQSRGDKYRDLPPRDGERYKGLYKDARHNLYVVVYLPDNVSIRLLTNEDSWTEPRRAALYNAIKDYLELPGWRNPTDETIELTAEQRENIDLRRAGKHMNSKPRRRTKNDAFWRRYY